MRPGLLRHLLAPLCLGFLPLAAQELKPGEAAPALPITKWLVGKPLENFAPGQVYVVEFWDAAIDLGVARQKDFAALQQKHGGKLAVVGIARDGEEINLHVAEAFYAQHGGGIDYRIGWDDGGKAHAAWLGATGREAPAVFVVDGKGSLVWSGAFVWLEIVLGPTLAGKVDPQALAAQVDKLDKRFTRVFVAAALKPQVAIEEMDKLLAEHAFLAPYLLPGVYSTLVEEKHAEFAARLAPRVADLGIRLGDVQLLNSLAWSIVDPLIETDKRDLTTAERAAAKAVELTKEQDPNVLDTLARVWFWKQDYAQAVAWQQKAVDKCEPGEDRDLLVGTLKTYQDLAAKK